MELAEGREWHSLVRVPRELSSRRGLEDVVNVVVYLFCFAVLLRDFYSFHFLLTF
jgi:hypothetical protein